MLKIKKRCIRCLTVLREDNTCPNPKCPKYVPDITVDKTPTEDNPTKERLDELPVR